MHILRSVAGKLILLCVIFVGVPILVYQQFQAADAEKTELLLRAIRAQGKAVALALEPSLKSLTPKSFHELNDRLSGFKDLRINIKVLLRPAEIRDLDDFYYIASFPAYSQAYLDLERAAFKRSGVFDRLDDSCARDEALTHRYVNPAGEDEVLTSIIPAGAAAGCWVVITSNFASDFGRAQIGRPYWSRLQVQFSLAVYFAMAALALALLVDVRRNLLRFARLARRIRHLGEGAVSFRAANRLPELDGVAVEFDAMVDSLTTSADAIRSTAEETAHALKTPIGVLSQAIEPLKRSLRDDDERSRKSIERIETAIERLGTLVERNRHLEEITAESLSPALERIDLNVLAAGLRESLGRHSGVDIDLTLSPRPVFIRGNERLIESAIENLVENAASFTPPAGRIALEIGRSGADGIVVVEDEGPGVEADDLPRIFERNFSRRAEAAAREHFGLGLWIVQRNTAALRGSVAAENRPEGGLRVIMRLPLDA